MYSGRKNRSVVTSWGWGELRLQGNYEETFGGGGIDMFIILIVVMVSQFCYVKHSKAYALNMCNLLYVDYTSTNLILKGL